MCFMKTLDFLPTIKHGSGSMMNRVFLITWLYFYISVFYSDEHWKVLKEVIFWVVTEYMYFISSILLDKYYYQVVLAMFLSYRASEGKFHLRHIEKLIILEF